MSFRHFAAAWALIAGIAGALSVRAAWDPKPVEKTCAQYEADGFTPDYVRLTDCRARGGPVAIDYGTGAGTSSMLYVAESPRLVYSYWANSNETPGFIEGLKQDGWILRLLSLRQRGLLAQRFGLESGFVIVNNARQPSTIPGFLLLLTAAFAAYLVAASFVAARRR